MTRDEIEKLIANAFDAKLDKIGTLLTEIQMQNLILIKLLDLNGTLGEKHVKETLIALKSAMQVEEESSGTLIDMTINGIDELDIRSLLSKDNQ